MNNNTKMSQTFFPNLDGLRFMAFLSVFISHCSVFLGYHSLNKPYQLFSSHFLVNGDLGVNFFFVLSGFLITHLLISEKTKYREIGLFNFYMRRVLRIWPVYFITVFIGLFIVPNLQPIVNETIPLPYKISADRLGWYLGFIANYEIIYKGVSSVVTTVLWSISVEEQFYFIWPLIIIITTPKQLNKILLLIIITTFNFRFTHYDSYDHQHYNTLSVISDLALGSLAASLVSMKNKLAEVFISIKKKNIVLIYLIGFSLIPLRGFSHIFGDTVFMIYCPFERLIFSFFFIFIIMEQNYSQHSFYKMSDQRWLSRLGKYSYGLYCYHMLMIFAVLVLFSNLNIDSGNKSFGVFIAEMITALTLCIAVGYFSFHKIEKYFINLKKKFSYTPGT